MSIIKEKPIRKTVIRGDRSLNLDTFENIILSDPDYTTKGENIIIVKGIDYCRIKLDSTTTEKVTIKSLTNCKVIPDIGRIDEDWDEIDLGKGSCVDFQNVSGVWYILSSDGLKME
jgi:hypothetical protein